MKDTGMTSMKVKKINKNKVYTFIYNEKTTCKLIITQKLEMGLSTVTQNLKALEDEGLICKNGFFDSTGGRKADALEIVKTAKISIGLAILKEIVQIVAVDLYGDIICNSQHTLAFSSSDDYYKEIGEYIDNFILNNDLASDNILGVSIATQGIISKDGLSVNYGEILGNSAMKLSSFEKYIKYPCRLEHDSKAAANLELWRNKNIDNGIILLLNRNMGGAVITDGIVQNGNNMRSGTIEHISMNSGGAVCYCGKRGCLETYCSANSLENAAGVSIERFFEKLRDGDTKCLNVWTEYLNYLALAIRNLSVVIDGIFIISGYLAVYFIEEDIEYLLKFANSYATFPLERESIILGVNGQYTQAAGAAIYYIKNYLKEI